MFFGCRHLSTKYVRMYQSMFVCYYRQSGLTNNVIRHLHVIVSLGMYCEVES